jgi:hypothetical protein
MMICCCVVVELKCCCVVVELMCCSVVVELMCCCVVVELMCCCVVTELIRSYLDAELICCFVDIEPQQTFGCTVGTAVPFQTHLSLSLITLKFYSFHKYYKKQKVYCLQGPSYQIIAIFSTAHYRTL